MKRSTKSSLIALAALVAACEKPPPPARAPEPPAAAAAAAAAAAVPAPPTEAILHPDAAKLAAAGPDSFIVHTVTSRGDFDMDRKSTRLNSSHANISYAVFCLKKK